MVLGGAVDSQDDTHVRGTAGLYPWIPGARSQWDGRGQNTNHSRVQVTG